MQLYKLDDLVISIKGNAAHLLNGLTSNSLDKPQNAFLNQHGRVIAVVFQKQIREDEYLLAVPGNSWQALSQHLDRYAKLNRTTLQVLDLKTFIDIELNQIQFLEENRANDISKDEFTLFRLDKKLPLMGVDFQADEFILNIDEFAYVSYTKGCFLGQEPVAKVHNRSKPSRKLAVQFEDQLSKEDASHMTSKVKDPTTERIKGFLFVANH